jgi:hypothetical protein
MRACVLTIVVLSFAPRAAWGQYNVPRETTHDSRSLKPPCFWAECWCGRGACSSIIPPPPSLAGSELGGSFDLVMAGEGTAVRPLDFADIAVFHVHGLVNVGRRAELFGGGDLLLWQPSAMDAPRWQAGLVGVRARATPWLASYARVQLGASLDSAAPWGQVEAAAQLRYEVPRFGLTWESALGGTYTRSPGAEDRTVHLGEVLAQSGVLSRWPVGIRWAVGVWWSLDVHVPVIDLDDDHDPRVRGGMSMGVLVGLGGGLDVFFEQAVVDRGDRDEPSTVLPNLSDGFDELRWRVGFNRRFGTRRTSRKYR